MTDGVGSADGTPWRSWSYPYEGGVGPDHPEGGPEDHARTTPGPDHLDDWQERLQAAAADASRRREARRQQREQLAAARAHGLKRRHHQKLNRKDKP